MSDSNDSVRLDELVTEYISDDTSLDMDELIEMDALIDKLTVVAEHGGIPRDSNG